MYLCMYLISSMANHADMFHVLNVHTCDNLYVCIMHYCIILDMLCIIVICIYNIKDKIEFLFA
jgi:hypothetical protein